MGDSQGTQGSPRATIVKTDTRSGQYSKTGLGSNALACIVILKKPFVPTRVRIETFPQAGDPRVPI